MLRLLAITEGVDLAIDAQDLAAGRDDRRAIPAPAVSSVLGEARLDPDIEVPRDCAGPRQRTPVGDFLKVKAEAGVAKLRQQDERTSGKTGLPEHPLDGRVVGGLVLPGDVELDGRDPHAEV